jgi:hypothetical protein
MLREFSTEIVFSTSRVLANPRLEIEDPFCCLIGDPVCQSYPEIEFSSDVDQKNSTTSKPSSG